MSVIRSLFFLLIFSSLIETLKAQIPDYNQYIDTMNVWIEENSFGSVLHLKRSAT